MRPKAAPLAEGAIWIEEQDGGTGIAREIAPIRPTQYAALQMVNPDSFDDSCRALIDVCDRIRDGIREFHKCSDSGEMHFHQMLHAAVGRHKRLLESIQLLVSQNKTEHAGALARVCYEAFLNFYVDWLVPEFFGPRLQVLAVVRTQQLDDRELEPLRNFPEFLENTARKARVSPLGEHYHEAIDPALSLIAHQSYAYLERESSTFADRSEDSDEMKRRLSAWLNVLTTAFLSRVANEVGLAWDIRPSADR